MQAALSIWPGKTPQPSASKFSHHSQAQTTIACNTKTSQQLGGVTPIEARQVGKLAPTNTQVHTIPHGVVLVEQRRASDPHANIVQKRLAAIRGVVEDGLANPRQAWVLAEVEVLLRDGQVQRLGLVPQGEGQVGRDVVDLVARGTPGSCRVYLGDVWGDLGVDVPGGVKVRRLHEGGACVQEGVAEGGTVGRVADEEIAIGVNRGLVEDVCVDIGSRVNAEVGPIDVAIDLGLVYAAEGDLTAVDFADELGRWDVEGE